MSWESRKDVIIRSYTFFGKRDHYAHFVLDHMIPIWMWLWQNGLERRKDFTVYYWEGAADYYKPMLDAFFTGEVKHIAYLRDSMRPQRVIIMGMEGHCRKHLGLDMKYFIGDPEPFMDALQNYAWERFDITPKPEPDLLIHVCREIGDDKDRGGTRRATSNESELGEALKLVATAKGLEYKKVFLAGKRLAHQIELFSNAKVVVAQHGAALANLFWMRKNTYLCEYHWNHKEEYRKSEMCGKMERPIHHGFSGRRVKANVVEAPCGEIVDYLMYSM